jgi:hypothetical protein
MTPGCAVQPAVAADERVGRFAPSPVRAERQYVGQPDTTDASSARRNNGLLVPLPGTRERPRCGPDGVVFDPLERDGSDLGLRIFVPGIEGKDVEDAHNAVLRALDHGLGEEKFADKVQFTEVRTLPPDAAATDYIPLRDLEKFIEWRDSRRRGAG